MSSTVSSSHYAVVVLPLLSHKHMYMAIYRFAAYIVCTMFTLPQVPIFKVKTAMNIRKISSLVSLEFFFPPTKLRSVVLGLFKKAKCSHQIGLKKKAIYIYIFICIYIYVRHIYIKTGPIFAVL